MCQWDNTIYNKYSKKKGECIKNQNKIDYVVKLKLKKNVKIIKLLNVILIININ